MNHSTPSVWARIYKEFQLELWIFCLGILIGFAMARLFQFWTCS